MKRGMKGEGEGGRKNIVIEQHRFTVMIALLRMGGFGKSFIYCITYIFQNLLEAILLHTFQRSLAQLLQLLSFLQKKYAASS